MSMNNLALILAALTFYLWTTVCVHGQLGEPRDAASTKSLADKLVSDKQSEHDVKLTNSVFKTAPDADSRVWQFEFSEAASKKRLLVSSVAEVGKALKISDLDITLYLKDGSTMKPPLEEPNSRFLEGIARHGDFYRAYVGYDLNALSFSQLREVQVTFRGVQSDRVKISD